MRSLRSPFALARGVSHIPNALMAEMLPVTWVDLEVGNVIRSSQYGEVRVLTGLSDEVARQFLADSGMSASTLRRRIAEGGALYKKARALAIEAGYALPPALDFPEDSCGES